MDLRSRASQGTDPDRTGNTDVVAQAADASAHSAETRVALYGYRGSTALSRVICDPRAVDSFDRN
jgi:hypothetical protein